MSTLPLTSAQEIVMLDAFISLFVILSVQQPASIRCGIEVNAKTVCTLRARRLTTGQIFSWRILSASDMHFWEIFPALFAAVKIKSQLLKLS